MKQYLQKHRDWISQFSSAFAGTLLGIGITLGITIYQEQAYKKETTRKFVVTTIMDVHNTNEIAKEKVKDLVYSDSLFMEVLEYYPNELDKVPITLINEFAQDITSFDYRATAKYSINQFLNNPEIINVFDDLSIVNTINALIETTKTIETLLAHAEECKTVIYDTFCNQQNYRNQTSGDEFIKQLLSSNLVINKMDRFSEYCMLLPQVVAISEQITATAMESLGITPEDLTEVNHRELGTYNYSSTEEEEE